MARVLLAVERGAQVLVLDEPAANLDVRAEAELNDRIVDIARANDGSPLVVVLVSHRLSTVRRADRIVVLDDGVVAEEGSHAELLERNGLYARLFEAQSSAYRDVA
jgi:ATP-binding cassette subfamily B protein